MISMEELQHRLRLFGPPLDRCEVKPLSQHVFTAAHEAKVCFLANMHGTPEYVEAELDLRSVKDETGVLRVADQLRQALEQRAEFRRSGNVSFGNGQPDQMGGVAFG